VLKRGDFMICTEVYLSKLVDLLRAQFGSRLVYVGLQGSYPRGEATEHSDIDIMVVIAQLSVSGFVFKSRNQ